MNYELIKGEFIKLKKEELDYLDYIDNIAKIFLNLLQIHIVNTTQKTDII